MGRMGLDIGGLLEGEDISKCDECVGVETYERLGLICKGKGMGG